MSLALVQSEDFLSDLEQQFEWYIHETNLDLPDAIELAEKFKIAVLDTLEFLIRHPGAGHRVSLSSPIWKVLAHGASIGHSTGF